MGISKKLKKKLRKARRAAKRAAEKAPKIINNAPKNLMKAAKNTLKDLKELGKAAKAMVRQSLELMKQSLKMAYVTPFLMAKAFLTTGDPDAARDVWVKEASKFGEEFNKLVEKAMDVAMKAIEMTPADKLLEKVVPQYEMVKEIARTMIEEQLKVIGDAAQSAAHFVGAIGNKSLGHCMRAGAEVAMYAAEFCSKASPVGTAASVALTAHELSQKENRQAIMDKVKELRKNPEAAAALAVGVAAEVAMSTALESGGSRSSDGFEFGGGSGSKGPKSSTDTNRSAETSDAQPANNRKDAETEPTNDTSKDTKKKDDDDSSLIDDVESAADDLVTLTEFAMYGPSPMMYADTLGGKYDMKNPKDAFPDFAKYDVFDPKSLMSMFMMPQALGGLADKATAKDDEDKPWLEDEVSEPETSERKSPLPKGLPKSLVEDGLSMRDAVAPAPLPPALAMAR